jgi:hypothetical protein
MTRKERAPHCHVDVVVEPRHEKAAAEIAANGGSLTATEIAHGQAWEYFGSGWSKARGDAMCKAASKDEGRPRSDYHAHDGGEIFRRRTS